MARRFSTDWLEEHLVSLPGPIDRGTIIGIGHVLEEIDSVLGRLQHPELVMAMGAELPKGILLHGAPGLGKTLVARYLASQLGPGGSMYELSADELTPQRVRGLFRHLAASERRSVVYLDEIDHIAMFRGWDNHSETTRATLIALLAALDGLTPISCPLVVTSSNRAPRYLDRALVRQGRIGYHVAFGHPGRDEREALLRLFLRPRPVADGLDVASLAALSRGFTPAGIRQAVDDATGLALAAGRNHIEQDDLVKGLRRDGQITEEADQVDPARLERTAIHEAGHAAVAVALRGPGYVTRVQVGVDGGDTAVGPEGRPENQIASDELLDTVAIAFGGIEAEVAILGHAALGAGTDWYNATRIVHVMAQHGLMPGLGGVDLGALGQYAGTTVPDMISTALPPILADARERASRIVSENAAAIRVFAETVLAGGGQLVERPLAEAIAVAAFRRPGS